jgi:NADH dehydrogenase
MTSQHHSGNGASGPQTIGVAGATGFVGRTLVRELLARGHHVRALVRSLDKAREVLPDHPSHLRLVQGDVLEAAAVEDLLRGATCCVNLIGIIREDRKRGQTFQRMHVDATRVLVQACERLGVARFVQMSALGVRDVGVSDYQHSKFEGESIVRLSNLRWTIFRPGLIHGKDGEFTRLAALWVKGGTPPFLFLPYFTGGREDTRIPLGSVQPTDPRVAPIAVEDVAIAFASAIEHPQAIGEVYNLVGPETLTWPQMLEHIRDTTPGAMTHLKAWGIPSEIAALQAKGAALLGLGSLLPFDEGMAKMGGEDSIADMTKAREDLRISPRPFRAAYARYAGVMG